MNRIFRLILHTLTVGILLAGLWCIPAAASSLDVRMNGARFSLEAKDADMADVLQAVAKKAGVRIGVAPGVTGRVTVNLSDLSLEDMLKQLCANRTIVYRYMPETDSYQILQAGAYTSAKEEQGQYTGDVQASERGQLQNRHAAGPGMSPKSGELDDENPTDSQGRLLYKPRELLVQFKAGTTDTQKGALHENVGATMLKRLIKQQIDRVKLPDGMTAAEAISRYSASPLVAVVKRHALRYPLLTKPNDTAYTSQWAPLKIKLPDAWDISTGSPRVIVAVIDTGVDYNHPDLAPNIDNRGWDFAGVSKYNITDGDADPMDMAGHGTHVAGILAAVGNNAQGVAGIAWNIRIMPLKVQADYASQMEEFDIIAAIDYAIAKGAKLVNCSFGGADYSQTEFDAFTRLRNAGILAVCAAGNDGENVDTGDKTYPAAYNLDNIIAVAASDKNDQLAGFSNFGAQSVHIMAPGGDSINGIYSTCLNGSYCYKFGTSMAAPHVTGVAALMLSKVPSLSYTQLKTTILNTVDPVDAVATKLITGGRLNAAAALAAVRAPSDLNNDGRIDLTDTVLALQILSGIPVAVSPGPLTMQADVNADGRIGLPEVIFILQEVAGLR